MIQEQKIKFSKKDKQILKTSNKIADIFKDSDTPITETIIEVGSCVNNLDNWISIDTPPEKSCDLILLQNGNPIVGGYSKEKESFCSLMGLMYSYLDANRTVMFRPELITHWQPLPQPPKQPTKKRGGCNP